MISKWVLTAPHAKCEGARHGPGVPYGGHPCDAAARPAARRLKRALKKMDPSADVVLIEATNTRAEGDLNRVATADYDWHEQWRREIETPGCCLLDIHSYDDVDSFDPSGDTVMTILDAVKGQGRVWTHRLRREIGANCHWVRGNDWNYIHRESVLRYSVPAVVIEFWEGLLQPDPATQGAIYLDSVISQVANALVRMSYQHAIKI